MYRRYRAMTPAELEQDMMEHQWKKQMNWPQVAVKSTHISVKERGAAAPARGNQAINFTPDLSLGKGARVEVEEKFDKS